MIQVENLTKRFGPVTALDRLTFNVEANRVTGFLGANGAGKTTTMRILACFLPATEGSASVGGFDVFTESMKVRRMLGYLPENVPAYGEMRTEEYLLFMAALKELPITQRRSEVDRVIESTWLQDVRRQQVGTLSKGFRQRVGLAEVMLHQPQMLILDEPTVGLDPSQIRQTRRLIKELGQRHTVLLSTHILTEVQMICDDLIIINAGRIAARDTLANLSASRGGGTVVVSAKGPRDQVQAVLSSIDGVKAVRQRDGATGTFELTVEDSPALREAISTRLNKHNWPLLELSSRSRTLEDIYIEIVSRDAA